MATTIEIAQRICATKFSDFPPEVVAYSKVLVLSGLGAMIAGASRDDGRIMTEYVKRMGGNPEATVFGTSFKTSVETAALANGNFAHSTEYEDDSFPEAISSYTIHPAVFALGEKLGASGADIIEAFVVGYETQARIALACLEARQRGILAISWAGTLGCAAAAAKLLKLDPQRTTMALSLAASQSSGLARQSGTPTHYFEMGMAARNGLTAALLAAGGFTGKPDIFEGERGFFQIITAGKIPAAEAVLEPWGKPFRVMQVGIKRYPCCFQMASSIDSAFDLKREHGLSAGDIEEIRVEVNLLFAEIIRYPEPRDEAETQFSIQHALAAAILEERLMPSSFTVAKIKDESFKAMRQKVKMVVREEWGWSMIFKPIITIVLKNGKQISKQPAGAVGQAPNLLGFDDVVEKYSICTEPRIAQSKVHASIEMLRTLENCNNINEIIMELTPTKPA